MGQERPLRRAKNIRDKFAADQDALKPPWPLHHPFCVDARMAGIRGMQVSRLYSEEDAQVLLGHSRIQTTAIYVERDIRRGRRIIQDMG